MTLIGKAGRVVYTLYAAILFIGMMLLVIPLVFLAGSGGKIKGGNRIYKIIGVWADCWFACLGIRQRNIYRSPVRKGAPLIFVANHISYFDIPVVVKVIRQPVRILGKAEMSKIPLFGYIYRKAAVMVDRSNARNRIKSVEILKNYLRKGISIFIFPEGTFNETKQPLKSFPLKSFYDGAFRIAIETQTPLKPVVFLDTVHRMHYSSIFSLNPGISRVVFLEEVPVDGLTLKNIPELKALVYGRMEECLKEFRDWSGFIIDY
jgi:1-acyl-sn-glycerol-3-phosphate acyltransferase